MSDARRFIVIGFLVSTMGLLIYPPLEFCLGDFCEYQKHGWIFDVEHYSIAFEKLIIYIILLAICMTVLLLIFPGAKRRNAEAYIGNTNRNPIEVEFGDIENSVLERASHVVRKAILDSSLESKSRGIPLDKVLSMNRKYFNENPGPVDWEHIEKIIRSVYSDSNQSSPVFFRLDWFFYVFIFLFPPLGIIIGLTGDIYERKNGKHTPIPRSLRINLVTVGVVLVILAIIRVFRHL